MITKETFAEYGWEFTAEAFASHIYKQGIYTLQYLHDKHAAYIAKDEPTDVQARVIYCGKLENEHMLELVMDLTFIRPMRHHAEHTHQEQVEFSH